MSKSGLGVNPNEDIVCRAGDAVQVAAGPAHGAEFLRDNNMNQRALAAEFIGTFAFVAAICAAALFAAPQASGTISMAIAAGLSILAMAYAVGHVSGGHFNPAVTLGLVAGGRFGMANALSYIVAQVAGGVAAVGLFALLLKGAPVGAGAARAGGLASIANTFGGAREFGLLPAFLVELVLAALLLIVIMGATSKRAAAGFGPIAIGFAMALFYLVAIPITNGSLNPARSTGAAVFGGAKALADLWVFWVAPILGGVIGGVISKWLHAE